MDVILLEKVTNLGDLGEKVSVKPGFGRNYLIPKGKAVPATADRIAEFEQRRAELEKAAAEKLAEAQTRAEAISALTLVITQKAGDEGKLFGSVGQADVADAVVAAGVELDKHEVRMPEGAIRQTGEYAIAVQLHADVTVDLTLTVEAED